MNQVTEFAIDLQGVYPWNKRLGWKLDYYKDADWIRIYFDSDRTILRDNINKIEALLKKYQLHGTLDTSWTWTDRYFQGIEFRNCDVTYALFITPSKELYKPVTINVSDTADELYDISLFSYQDAVIKNGVNIPKITNFSRTDYGFQITFYTKKAVMEFYKQNPFRRVLDVTEVLLDSKKIYYCDIYMDDKIPNPVPIVKFTPTTKRTAKKILKSIPMNSQALIESALAKLTDEEKEALGLLAYAEL